MKDIFINSKSGNICPVRLFGVGFAVITCTSFLVLAFITVLRGQPLDYTGFGAGFAAIWSATGLSIGLKQMSEQTRNKG